MLPAFGLTIASRISGPIFRQIHDVSAVEIIFYRGISLSTTISLFVIRRDRPHRRALGGRFPDILEAAASGAAAPATGVS